MFLNGLGMDVPSHVLSMTLLGAGEQSGLQETATRTCSL